MGGASGFEAWTEAFRRHQAATSPEPIGLVVDRAEGAWVIGADGRRYLDLLAGIGVANIGHTHPRVVEAVRRQSERHPHVMVYGEYVQEEQALYARELADVLPGDLDTVYFVNSGAEAIEGALKLARKATGRAGLVSFGLAYHGDTMGALSLAGNPIYQVPFEPLLEPVRVLPFGDVDALRAIDETTAAVFVEPIQGEAGVRVPPDGFLPELGARCREVGALWVADEVMTGFGRTGRRFAVERWNVVPDVMVLAKALGGGYPLGAFVARRDLMTALSNDPPLAHVTTFGGHPVSCAAGRAALHVLLEGDLPERAEAVGRRFRARLREALPEAVAPEVRGHGLMVGVVLDSAERTRRCVEVCRERGLLLGWTLHQDRILRLTPPLNIEESDLERAVETLRDVLGG